MRPLKGSENKKRELTGEIYIGCIVSSQVRYDGFNESTKEPRSLNIQTRGVLELYSPKNVREGVGHQEGKMTLNTSRSAQYAVKFRT